MEMTNVIEQGVIWGYYKPRHTHSWNMLQLAARHLAKTDGTQDFETEYAWENLIIRLCLYRNTIKTLTKLVVAESDATKAIQRFDETFMLDGKNTLTALRNMFEHFDDYAAGSGRGPANRDYDLDPWRVISIETYCRGQFRLELTPSMMAANTLHSDARGASDKFISWYRNNTNER